VKIICCIKPVPDPASRLSINETKTWIKTQELSYVAAEADNYALEEALRLKEKLGGEVVVLSLGGDEAAKVLRAGLAMGADRAIHVTVDRWRGPFEQPVAHLLARAIEKDGGADLILAGVQSDDLGTGATGVMVAEFLSMPHATVVVGVDLESGGRAISARREMEGGTLETVELPLPALLTIQYGANQPRYATLKGIMAAKKKPFSAWTADELGEQSAAPAYAVRDLAVPDKKSKVQILSGTPEEAVTLLVEKLRKEAKVL
jgi:electron transfer flavoprotein beta subunit